MMDASLYDDGTSVQNGGKKLMFFCSKRHQKLMYTVDILDCRDIFCSYTPLKRHREWLEMTSCHQRPGNLSTRRITNKEMDLVM